MRRVALTGGIATGKSYIARRLRAEGVPVVDADVLAHEAVARGTSALAAIVQRFGPAMLREDGELNRPKLGDVVFQDDAARRDLEAIVHPVVRRGIAMFFEQLPPETPLAVADIPLLYETHGESHYDAVIVAACEPATQLARIMARDGVSREAAERRVAAQWPIADKVKRADFVIRTDGTHAETDAQIRTVLASIARRH